MESIYLNPEHELLREQVARFVAREVEPHALAWEDAGTTPREVLRKSRRRAYWRRLGYFFMPMLN